MFANEGKNSSTNCKYSYRSSDIKMYVMLGKHMVFLGDVLRKAWDKTNSSTNRFSSQATTGAKGTTTGVNNK